MIKYWDRKEKFLKYSFKKTIIRYILSALLLVNIIISLFPFLISCIYVIYKIAMIKDNLKSKLIGGIFAINVVYNI